MSNFKDVGEFHGKFGLPVAGSVPIRFLAPGEAAYRQNFIREELNEYAQAHLRKDMVALADALVDLAYVVLGTAHYHGLPWEELFAAVQGANMRKERGEGHRRGPCESIVKPPGWSPPDLLPILRRHGWKG